MITKDAYFVNPADSTNYGDVLGVILFSKNLNHLIRLGIIYLMMQFPVLPMMPWLYRAVFFLHSQSLVIQGL